MPYLGNMVCICAAFQLPKLLIFMAQCKMALIFLKMLGMIFFEASDKILQQVGILCMHLIL
ncbi:MAG: hypothetical protein EAY75_17060 [Bacteroidetes bacterium]|nr:MAG: hypothetical protein EAY75_17060 [Bacteroidota bacterium]